MKKDWSKFHYTGRVKCNEIKDYLTMAKDEITKSNPSVKNLAQLDRAIAVDLYYLYYTEDQTIVGNFIKEWYEDNKKTIARLYDTQTFIGANYPEIDNKLSFPDAKVPLYVKDELQILYQINVNKILKDAKSKKPTPAVIDDDSTDDDAPKF